MNHFSLTPKGIESLVTTSLPGFSPKRKIIRSTKILDLGRRNIDGIFERILIEFEFENNATAISIQLASNYFPECPILGGPFGHGMSLSYLLNSLSDNTSKALQKYWYSNSWHQVTNSLSSEKDIVILFSTALKTSVRSVMIKWANQLLSNETLRMAVSTYTDIESRNMQGFAEEIFAQKLNGYTLLQGDYPIEKIIRQLVSRLNQIKNWYSL